MCQPDRGDGTIKKDCQYGFNFFYQRAKELSCQKRCGNRQCSRRINQEKWFLFKCEHCYKVNSRREQPFYQYFT